MTARAVEDVGRAWTLTDAGHVSDGSPRGRLRVRPAAEDDVSRKLPITASIQHALLIAGTTAPVSWRTLATLPLGAGPAAEVGVDA